MQKLPLQKENEFFAQIFGRSCLRLGSAQEYQSGAIEFPNKPLPQNYTEAFALSPFCDPFTSLAAKALQTLDPRFVSRRKIYAFYRFVVSEDGQSLDLQQIPEREATSGEQQENIRAVTWYRNFIIEEFGADRLQFVDAVYGFSLAEMIQKGLPLVPDHIFKTNIGMNKIGLSDIKTMFNNLLGALDQTDGDP